MGTISTIRDIFGPAFWRAWNDFLTFKYETFCFSGGRGSLKSSTIAAFILLGIERDRRDAFDRKDGRNGKGIGPSRSQPDPKWKHYLTHAICYRKVMGTCEQSVYSEIEKAAYRLNIHHKYVFKKSPLKIVRRGTGQMILFRGLDDPEKSKSTSFPFSFARYLWFEEASEFDGIEELRNVSQSIHRGGDHFETFYSYNPPETAACWVNYEMAKQESEDPTFKTYKSDYRSVPISWLGDKFYRDAAILFKRNERAFRHEYLGEITGNGGTVFPNIKGVKLSDEEISHFANIRWGCDFGVRDPTVLIGAEYQPGMGRLILFKEVYQPNMMLDEMERRFKETIDGDTGFIMADCAASQMIMELENRGINVLPCRKGRDSIMHGIKWLQNLNEILIDVDRCPNAFREFSYYEYEKIPGTDEFTSRLPDKDNHAIDSVRYMMENESLL